MTHVRALIWKLSFLRFFQTGFLRTTSEAFPSGGRWPGAAGSDEGATGYPTEQKNTGVQAAGRWARAFYKERLGTESPPHQSASQTASPQGEAAVSYRSTTLIPFVRNACPSPPSRGAGRYGRRLQVCRKKKNPPSPVPETREGGSREEETPPPWCSFLHFSQEKWRPPAGTPRGAAPRGWSRGTACRVRTIGGRAPGPTWQVPTCARPNGTAYR